MTNRQDPEAIGPKDRHAAYQKLIAECPEWFNSSRGPLPLRASAEELADFESKRPEDGPVGKIYGDSFVLLLRDLVEDQHGSPFPYVRVLSRPSQSTAGVAILPVTESGAVVLFEHFRHATRDWHWECPRGYCDTEHPELDVARELQEELGCSASKVERLGTMHPNTGLLREEVMLFLAEVKAPYRSEDPRESVRNIREFTIDELNERISESSLRDAFTLAAILQARVRGLID